MSHRSNYPRVSQEGQLPTDTAEVDLSTPEATVATYYRGYMAGNKHVVEQTFLTTPHLEEPGFTPPVIAAFRILKAERIEKTRLFGEPGDVEVTTEVSWRTPHPAQEVRFVLRHVRDAWKILSYSAVGGEE
jgi:hypothetical protein